MASAESLFDRIKIYGSRISMNLSKTVSRYTLQDYIRLVLIIGAYCLVRPYLIRIGGKFQAKDHEREVDLDKLSSPAAVKSRNAASALRGIRYQVPEDTDSEQEDGMGADWGKSARRRQRLMLNTLLGQAENEKDDDEDKDIQDLLED